MEGPREELEGQDRMVDLIKTHCMHVWNSQIIFKKKRQPMHSGIFFLQTTLIDEEYLKHENSYNKITTIRTVEN